MIILDYVKHEKLSTFILKLVRKPLQYKFNYNVILKVILLKVAKDKIEGH